MEVQVSGSKPSPATTRGDSEEDRLRLKRKTLQAVLDQCQRALESLSTTADGGDDDEEKEDRDSGSGGEAVDEARARRRLCMLTAKLTRVTIVYV